MISIVIVGRNDNYGGDFDGRLVATTSHNTRALAARGIEHEIIFVEWNPIGSNALLSQRVVSEFERARCIVVTGPVHRYVCENHAIAVYEYLAKNVGARRAKGDHILITNPDNFFGQDILDFLERDNFDRDTLYRAGWINIEDATQVDSPTLVDYWMDDASPFCCASGDFIFCERSLFDRVGGFREDLGFTNTHKDSIFCLTAFGLTSKAEKIGRTYHLTHGRDLQERRRLEYRYQEADRTRQSTYGLTDLCVEKPMGDRITQLRLRTMIRLSPRLWRRTPQPRIPLSLQVDPAPRPRSTWDRIKREVVRTVRRLAGR